MNDLLKQQEEIKQRAFAEAMRYMENAKDTLKKARKEDNYYEDKKYVRTACGTAYNAVLIALDAFLLLKGVPSLPKKKRKSIEYYLMHVAEHDRKLLKDLNSVYNILHLDGYYDGLQDARVIAVGFDNAIKIIERIRPDNPIPWSELTKPSPFSRLSSFLLSFLG
ncbi:MAG: DUF5618 family protein [Bacteroidales bacterium]